MKTITLLALVTASFLLYAHSAFSQTDAKVRLKYPLALDIPGKVYTNPGPVNTMPSPLDFLI